MCLKLMCYKTTDVSHNSIVTKVTGVRLPDPADDLVDSLPLLGAVSLLLPIEPALLLHSCCKSHTSATSVLAAKSAAAAVY